MKSMNEWQQKHSQVDAELSEVKKLQCDDSRKSLEQQTEEENKAKTKHVNGYKKFLIFITKYVLRYSQNILYFGLHSESPKRKQSSHNLSDHLRRKYERKNIKRLMKTLLKLKQFNLETIAMHINPEKNRLEYNKEKKKSIENNFSRIHNEISEARARLILSLDADQETERMETITKNAINICQLNEFHYDFVEMDLEKKV